MADLSNTSSTFTVYRLRRRSDWADGPTDQYFATAERLTRELKRTTHLFPVALTCWDGTKEVVRKVGLSTITLTPIEVKQ